MSKKRAKLSEQIRQAVNDSDLSCYRICKMIGMDKSIMSRFMNRRGGLQQDSLDAIADILNLNLAKPTAKAGKGQVKRGKHFQAKR